MAQHVDTIAPHTQYGFVNYYEDEDRYGVVYQEFIGCLIKSVQELNERLERLENAEKNRGD